MPKTLPFLDDPSPVCVAPLGTAAVLSEADAIGLAVRLKALADPTRLRMLAFMLDRPGREACTCELAPLVRLSDPTVSHHLKTMEKAGLVVKERRGASVYYQVVPAAIHAIAVALHLDVRD